MEDAQKREREIEKEPKKVKSPVYRKDSKRKSKAKDEKFCLKKGGPPSKAKYI